MVVVNIVGFPYKLKLRSGTSITVPNDNMPHEVPDEVGENKFDNVFQILVPAKPKVIEPIRFVQPVQKVPEIIEIDLGDSHVVEDSKIVDTIPINEVIIENKQTPLKGIKIKKAKREKLIKNNFTKN